MRLFSICLVTVAALVLASCSVRVPIVTDTEPQYPTFVYPNVVGADTKRGVRQDQRDAWSFLQVGQIEEAERRFTELFNSDRMFYPALTGLGWVSLAQGSFADAAGYFDAALNLESEYGSALVGKADVLLALGDTSAALQAYENAFQAVPSLARVATVIEELRFQIVTVRLGEARTAFSEGRLDDSSRAYREIVGVSPESSFLYVELGLVLIDLGQYEAALIELKRAQRLDPNDSTAILLEGQLLKNRGDLVGASEAYERALEVDQTGAALAALERLTEMIRLAELPSEYRDIAGKRQITRGEVAAVMGVNLDSLIAEAGRDGSTLIFTDIRNHWANEWIVAITKAGLMSVEGRYNFEPDRFIRRAAFAEVLADVLVLIENRNQTELDIQNSELPIFSDLQVDHLNYADATKTVAAGVLPLFDGNRFFPTRPVSGAEAADAVGRLLWLLNSE